MGGALCGGWRACPGVPGYAERSSGWRRRDGAPPLLQLRCSATAAPSLARPQALAAAESVSGEGCPRVALVLLLTAQLYSRTGRVTLAEGLYREAAKMLQLRPGGEEDTAAALALVHPSVGALLAWRHCQLLTALPRRSTGAGGGLGAGRWEAAAVTWRGCRQDGLAASPAVPPLHLLPTTAIRRGGDVGEAGASAARGRSYWRPGLGTRNRLRLSGCAVGEGLGG